MLRKKIIIIGAGIGGLTAAYRLRQRGYEVEVLEAGDRPGGRIKRLERNGDIVDVGTQFFHSNFKLAWGFLDELGLGATKRRCRGKIRYQLMDGPAYDYDERLMYMKPLKPRGNLKLLQFMIRHIVFGPRFENYRIGGDIPPSDELGVLDYFKNETDKPLRDFLIMPVCTAASSATPEWTSLYHFIRTLGSLMSSHLIGLTGGISSFAYELAKRLPVRYEAPVEKILSEKGKVVGVLMKDGSARKAAHVVSAVEAASAARIMPDELAAQRRFFEGVAYSPLPMPVFFLDRPLRKDIWSYWNDPRLSRTFKYVLDEQAKVPEMLPSGKSALTAWSVFPENAELMKQSDQAIISKAREDVELMIPGFSSWIEEAVVIRHPFTAELFSGGAYRRVADFIRESRSLQGISFVSALFGGTSMEAAIESGADAVERVCNEVK